MGRAVGSCPSARSLLASALPALLAPFAAASLPPPPPGPLPQGTIFTCAAPQFQAALSLFAVRVADARPAVRVDDGVGTSLNPAFNPQTGDLLFASDRTGSWDVLATRLPTSQGTDGAGREPHSIGTDSSFSADGHRTSAQAVATVASSPPSLNDRPSVDPTGTRVVFVSTRGGPEGRTDNVGWAALHVAPATPAKPGSPPAPAVRITQQGNGAHYSPAWSPDGAWIAAANGTGDVGGTDVVVMRPDGSDRRVVARNGGWPSWAPNSSVMYFHRSVGADLRQWRVWAVDLAGPGSAAVPPPPPHQAPRAVSPEGWSVLTPSAHPRVPALLAVAAVVNGTRHIAVLDVEAGTVTPVTTGRPGALASSAHWNPAWAPDGDTIVFSRCRGEGTTMPNIRAAASPVKGLAVRYVNGDFPQLSPDGEWLGLTGHGAGGLRGAFSSVDVMRPNGTGRRVVWEGATWMLSWDPSVAPDRARIAVTTGGAFVSSLDATVGVALIGVAGAGAGAVTNLTSAADLNTGHPTFAPDGRSVVVRSARGLPANTSVHRPGVPFTGILWSLWRLNLSAAAAGRRDSGGRGARQGGGDHEHNDGSEAWTRVTTHYRAGGCVICDIHPAFSPDGEWITFASDRGHAGRPSVWKVRADGTGLVELFDRGAFSVHPNWSPDGGLIVFSTSVAGYNSERVAVYQSDHQAELFVMGSDGSAPWRLTHDLGQNAHATWSAVGGGRNASVPIGPEGWHVGCRYPDIVAEVGGALGAASTAAAMAAMAGSCPVARARAAAAGRG